MRNKKGFSLIEVMIVAGLIALLAALVFPSLLRSVMSANQSFAGGQVRTISHAIEMYALTNGGVYPRDESELVPSYLKQPYDKEVVNGYQYAMDLSTDGYTITATPVSNTTGSIIYMAYTGGILDAITGIANGR